MEKVSLVITTYNNPAFLELVLKSVLRQRVMPDEVIIADDGSTEETRRLVKRYAELIPVPMVHSWIPDRGFRVAKSRNMAIAKSTGEYIVIIDGDMVLSSHFIEDHIRIRQEGCFVAGSRARLKRNATQERCKTMNDRFSFFSKGLSRRLVMIRSRLLHRLIKGHDGLRNARSCHMAFWKRDFVLVNGFEEEFEGWGSEDSELVVRFYNNGLKRKNAKLMAPAVHLYHNEKTKDNAERNAQMLRDAMNTNKMRARKGINQYMDDCTDDEEVSA